jgi:uncharacterized protein (TIGR02757 family)
MRRCSSAEAMRTRPVRQDVLRQRLNELVATFDISTITPDPLQLVLRYTDPRDQEIAGILAAAFAYGRADIVVANVGRVLEAMAPSPYAYLVSFDEATARRTFARFTHRFQKMPELVAFLSLLAMAVREHGTLGALFEKCYDAKDRDIGPSLQRFVETVLSGAPPKQKQLRYLLTSPADGSACKRMNLFLRWMVRRSPPDIGIWTFVAPAKLVVPLDTHVHRIATFLGLSKRKSADWKAAREITDRLAKLDVVDPVRYDFAICRLGILDLCSRKRRKENCDVCMLRDVCRFPVQ